MAVNIPTLQRTGSAVPLESGRIEASLPNPESIAAPLQQASSTLVQAGVKYVEREMEAAANDAARQAGLELRAEYNRGFETGYTPEDKGLKYKSGPQAFNEGRNALAEKLNSKYQELLSRDGISGYAQSKIKTELDKTMGTLDSNLTVWEGKAKADYRAVTVKAKVLSLAGDMVNDASIFDMSKPESRAPMENRIVEIQQTLEQEAIDNGEMVVGEDGKPQFTRGAQIKIARGVSEAVKNAIENVAVTPGQAEKAKMLYDMYGDYVDMFGKEQTKKLVEKLSMEQGASTLASQIVGRNMSEEETEATLSKLPAPAASETRKEIARQLREKESIYNNRAKAYFREVHDNVFETMNSTQPYPDIQTAKKVNRAVWDKLTPEQQKTIEKMVERPTKSNSNQLTEVMEAFQSGKFDGMTATEFSTMTAGLATTDQRIYTRLWNSANNPSKDAKAESQLRAQYIKRITGEMKAQGLLPTKGNLSKSQLEKRGQYQIKLLHDLDQLPESQIPKPNSTEAELFIKKSIREYDSDIDYEEEASKPKVKQVGSVGISGAFNFSKASPKQQKARNEMRQKGLLQPASSNDTFDRIDKYIKENGL